MCLPLNRVNETGKVGMKLESRNHLTVNVMTRYFDWAWAKCRVNTLIPSKDWGEEFVGSPHMFAASPHG